MLDTYSVIVVHSYVFETLALWHYATLLCLSIAIDLNSLCQSEHDGFIVRKEAIQTRLTRVHKTLLSLVPVPRPLGQRALYARALDLLAVSTERELVSMDIWVFARDTLATSS